MHPRSVPVLVLFALLPGASLAAANAPPDAPVWLEPVPGDVVSPFDPHFNVFDFSDADGDGHLRSDFEVWDDSLNVRVWSALDTEVLVHIHLGDGALEGPLAGETRLDFDRPYRVRARFQDDSGAPNDLSDWSVWVPFRTATQTRIFPMLLDDVADALPEWKTITEGNVFLPHHGGVPAALVLRGGGDEMLRVFGTSLGNDYLDQPALPEHRPLQVVLAAGTRSIDGLPASRIRVTDDEGAVRAIYLPPVSLAVGDSLFFWIDDGGNSYWGTDQDSLPDYSMLAQGVFVPWETADPFYDIDRVVTNLNLPVNIAFVPDPGPDSSDVFFYVTELYGKVKAVTRGFTVSVFADSLLNFEPTGDFPGSGEMGVTGICVDPASGDVFVTGAYDDPLRPHNMGTKYNRVLRLFASADGLTSTGRATVLDSIPSFASHQIQSVTIGPDGKLWVNVGDGFAGGAVAENPNDLRGKILRMNLDGTPPGDNPYGPLSLVYAVAVRNPFGAAWREADGKLYTTDNGTNWGDRVLRIEPAWDYGYCCDFEQGAVHVFGDRVGPTALDFDDGGVLGSSNQGKLFVAWSGPTYAVGQVPNGKRIWEIAVDDTGGVVFDREFLRYTGVQFGTIVGLAIGPDGLYFTDLYGEGGFDANGLTRANIYRVKQRTPTGADLPGPGPRGEMRVLLGPPFPNPTAGSSAVRFRLDRAAPVRAGVIDARGRRVRELHDGMLPRGTHELHWDGTVASGARAAAGVYWIHVQAGQGSQEAARVVLLR